MIRILICMIFMTSCGIRLLATDIPEGEAETVKEVMYLQARCVGIAKNGKDLDVEFDIPDDRRIKDVDYFIQVRDVMGETIGESWSGRSKFPYDRYYGFGTGISVSANDKHKDRLQKLMEHPELLSVSCRATFTFVKAERGRQVESVWTDNGLEYQFEMHPGEIAYFLNSEHRWGKEWAIPMLGNLFPSPKPAAHLIDFSMYTTLRLTPPAPDEDKNYWIVNCGEKSRTNYTLKMPNINGTYYHGGSSSAGKTLCPRPNETAVESRSFSLPINGGVEIYMIPFREVDGYTDHVIVAIASDLDDIRKRFQIKPGYEDFDWEKKLSKVILSEETEKSDEQGD